MKKKKCDKIRDLTKSLCFYIGRILIKAQVYSGDFLKQHIRVTVCQLTSFNSQHNFFPNWIVFTNAHGRVGGGGGGGGASLIFGKGMPAEENI